MMGPRLLKPKKVVIQLYSGINHAAVLKLLRARKQKKYGFLEIAYDVEEIGRDKYNVRMEYIVKDW